MFAATKKQLEDKILKLNKLLDGFQDKKLEENTATEMMVEAMNEFELEDGEETKKRYYCNQCSGVFRNRGHLSDHASYCHTGHSKFLQVPKYFCDQCPMRFVIKTDLLIHLEFYHGEIKFPRIPSQDQEGIFTKHYVSASDFYKKNPGACDICNQNLKTPEQMLEHKNKYHPEWDIEKLYMTFSAKEYIYKCTRCSGAFRLKEDFDLHRHCWHQETEKTRRRQAVRNPRKCLMCDENFETRHQLWEHKLRHAHAILYPKPICLNIPENMTEEETDKKLEALQKMLKLGQYADEFDFDKTEIEAKIKAEPERTLAYKCDFCSGAFPKECLMWYHVQECHRDKQNVKRGLRYFCDRCPARFEREHCLVNHILDNYEEGLDKKTGKRRCTYKVHEVLDPHRITESDFYAKYPGACNNCFMDFDTVELMLEHKNDKHPGWENEQKPKVYVDEEYSFKCDERMCGGQFRLEDDFLRHQKMVIHKNFVKSLSPTCFKDDLRDRCDMEKWPTFKILNSHKKMSKICYSSLKIMNSDVIFCNKCWYHYFKKSEDFLAHSQEKHNGTATGVPRKLECRPGGDKVLVDEGDVAPDSVMSAIMAGISIDIGCFY